MSKIEGTRPSSPFNLFIENNPPRGTSQSISPPRFTLSSEDKVVEGVVYPSLYRLYMSMEDPTEYLFATTHIGSWRDWQILCNSKTLGPELSKWKEELSLKIKVRAIQNIMDSAKEGGRLGFEASKFLAKEGWIEKAKAPEEKKVKVSKENEILKIKEHMKLIGLEEDLSTKEIN